ncbi:MAG TPA: carbonic anhydrase [Devosia sp.]|nr:carbonic anhydrase [Devosia sp.]
MHSFPQHLIDGYRQFLAGRYARETERYKELARGGQSPTTMIICCCDSRAAPETIFDAGPGELFVLRNIANLVPPFEPVAGQHGTSAGIEYAVNALGISDLIVLGHGRCGGIRWALGPGTPIAQGDFIGKWMSMLAPVTEQVATYTFLTPAERETALERLSVRNSIKNLRTFPYIREKEAAGQLTLHGAWFDISTAELWVMDAETGDFSRPEVD